MKRHGMTYEEMVKSLFKTEGMHTEAEGVMHAAIGIAGEVGEILLAIENENIKNLKEELGDTEFYIEALTLGVPLNIQTLSDLRDSLLPECEMMGDHRLSITASHLLDSAKKCWVYGHKVHDRIPDLTKKLAMFLICLDMVYTDHGIEIDKVLADNMDKLIGPEGRYPGKMYCDKHAQERADKKGAE